MKLTNKHTYPEVKEGFLRSTPVPQAATSKRIGRLALLITYFWFGCFAYVRPNDFPPCPNDFSAALHPLSILEHLSMC
jgi:hypothetical protein